MRLKHIKLVGFKSFVDSTTVPFPEQMTAIVGPNGCGKSNVIDAVRWVLGESSAKNLRGDAMTDVIFNGSTNRKPVSQASVELLFDNTEGKLEGQLANRSEISIKRQVTKDAVSTYFLNGTKCRRRDITDIFLGTGLGPRSYAIIEQGMISRLIESKPQELRVFLEEAAGISKYKERRRETENRIKHTRENLERLADVREELGTQLEKLKRQAATAKRYKELKKQERQYKAELAALKWHKYNEQANFHDQQRKVKETELESFVAKQRGGELGLLNRKEQLQELTDSANDIQQKVFQTSNAITKLEQQIHFEQEKNLQQSQQLQQVEESLAENQQHLDMETIALEDIEAQLLEFEPEQEMLSERLFEAERHLLDAEQNYEQHQVSLSQRLQELTKAQQAITLIETKLQHAQLEQTKTQKRIQDVTSEIRAIDEADQVSSLTQLQMAIDEQQEMVTDADEQVAVANKSLSNKQQLYDEQSQQLQQLQRSHQRSEDKLAQLEQWRSEYLLATLEDAEQQNNIRILGDLIAQLDIEPSWQTAIEQLLSHHGRAQLVSAIPNEALVNPGQYVVKGDAKKLVQHWNSISTAASVVTAGSVPSWFEKVALVESVAEGQQVLEDKYWLAAILPSGQWIGPNWVGLGSISAQSESGALARLKEIEQLSESTAQLATQVASAERELTESSEQLLALKEAREKALAKHSEAKEKIQKLELEHEFASRQVLLAAEQKQKLVNELESLRENLEETELTIQMFLEEQLNAQELEMTLSDKNQQSESDKSTLQAQLNNAKMTLESTRQESHQLSLKLQSLQNTRNNLKQNVQRAKQHIEQLFSRKNELTKAVHQTNSPQELRAELEQNLADKLVLEEQLLDVNSKAAVLDEEIKTLEQGQSGVLAQLEKMREEIANIKMDCESARVRAQTVLESLKEMDQGLKALLENMPAEAEEKTWAENLEKTTQSIQRLGAINLAAIEEYELQAERKGYLDEQFNDLTSALETLEAAIRKIDRESRSKFKETYDKVNDGLQTLFPKVFGGGAAYLELTDDDLLETGVTIMARPPGKKNSTIHLLSGGEKALTALSLVFSIFKLNPAPFCMLDEVDAPLDDANVGRFCKLVNEMSDSVQFIYISHNKVAMEMATHLTGVTMQEPGVSRLVAVDIQQAVEMAEAI